MNATAEWLDIDFYDVLGVSSDATQKEIKSAYRKLARTAHPDANPGDVEAEERFSDIAKAYEVLSDEDRRKEYNDLRTQAAYRRQSSAGSNQWSSRSYQDANFVDFDFDTMFGEYFAEQQRRPRRGSDLSASLHMEFIDAIQGLTTTLTLDGRSVNVRIPAGVKDRQTIRLAGKGAPGLNGGPEGDLLIEVSVGSHPTFGRSGNNLTTTVPIRYEDAVLGGEVSVPTLDGSTVTVRIPPGSANGQKLRVKGKGVPLAKRTGDLIVAVTIDVPKDVSDEERSLLEQLRVLRDDVGAAS